MRKHRIINGRASRLQDCADTVVSRYRAQGYEAQQTRFTDGSADGILVQIKNAGDDGAGWFKALSGLQTCACLKLTTCGEDLSVEAMAGKWIDKIAVQVVSWVVLWPLTITSIVGMYRQGKLVENVFIDALICLSGMD